MNSIGSFPESLPLRESLPKMRTETTAALIAWACAQPGSMRWLLKRAAEYWDRVPDAVAFGDKAAVDTHHAAVEATCALELLRWRIQAPTDRAAVEHLNTPLGNDQADTQRPGEKGKNETKPN